MHVCSSITQSLVLADRSTKFPSRVLLCSRQGVSLHLNSWTGSIGIRWAICQGRGIYLSQGCLDIHNYSYCYNNSCISVLLERVCVVLVFDSKLIAAHKVFTMATSSHGLTAIKLCICQRSLDDRGIHDYGRMPCSEGKGLSIAEPFAVCECTY